MKTLLTLIISFFSIVTLAQEQNESLKVHSSGDRHTVRSSETADINDRFILDLSKSKTKLRNSSSNNMEVLIEKSSSATQHIEVFGGGGDDNLIINLEEGFAPFHIVYDGQENEEGTQGDVLEVHSKHSGISMISIPHGPHSGVLEIGESSILYKGLEPITATGLTNFTFTAALGSANSWTINDDATTGDGFSIVTSPAIEDLTFEAPSSSLNINLNDNDDVLTFVNLDANWNLATLINLDGGLGFDELIVDVHGLPFTDNGSVFQLEGSYSFNYINFERITIINAPKVPTMSEWGLLFFIILLAAGSLAVLFRSMRKKSEEILEIYG